LPQKVVLVFFNKLLYSIDLCSAESAAILQPNRVEPEFSLIVLTLNVNVWWLLTISGVKEESVRAVSQYGRHNTR